MDQEQIEKIRDASITVASTWYKESENSKGDFNTGYFFGKYRALMACWPMIEVFDSTFVLGNLSKKNNALQMDEPLDNSRFKAGLRDGEIEVLKIFMEIINDIESGDIDHGIMDYLIIF